MLYNTMFSKYNHFHDDFFILAWLFVCVCVCVFFKRAAYQMYIDYFFIGLFNPQILCLVKHTVNRNSMWNIFVAITATIM